MIHLNKKHTGFTKDIKLNLLKENWSFDNKYNINDLLYINNIEKINSIEKEYSKLINYLNCKENINYQLMLGSKVYSKRIKEIKEKIDNLKNSEYLNYSEVIEKRINFTSKFKEFYYKDELINPMEYDHVNSSTGRVKIVNSKINLLTMKKDNRSNILSTYVKGRIYSLDIVSLEPRVMMHIQGVRGIDDLYSHIQSMLSRKYERSKIKIGVISTIYGGADKTVKSVSGIDYSDITIIKEFFGIQKFIDKYKNKDIIKNYYGRPLKVTNAIVNHYIQSSSADCAILAFNSLMNSWKDYKINFIGFIHDAIIIDVHPEDFEKVNSLSFVYEEKMDIKLPVKAERIS